MNTHRPLIVLAAAVTAIATGGVQSASAQAISDTAAGYPARPLRMLVPFPAGGPADGLSRLIAQKLSEAWGQPMVVENRGGAGGIVGMEIAARAAPDGYTVINTAAGIAAINPHLYRKLPYDHERDFAPLSMGAFFAHLLSVHPSVPARSVQELVDLARRSGDKLTFGSAGIGTPNHLAGELFKSMSRTSLVHVPFKGAAAAVTDLLGGHVALMFCPLPLALPHAATGRLRVLAATTRERLAALPDVPTLAQSGLPGYEAIAWNAFVVPAGTPRPIISKLNAAILRVLATPEVRDRLRAEGSEPWGTTPEQLAAFIRSESAKWGKVVRESGARAE